METASLYTEPLHIHAPCHFHPHTLTEQGKLSAYYRMTILEMSNKVVESLTAYYEKVVKGVKDIMGGTVLNYKAKEILHEGEKAGAMAEKKRWYLQCTRMAWLTMLLQIDYSCENVPVFRRNGYRCSGGTIPSVRTADTVIINQLPVRVYSLNAGSIPYTSRMDL